MDAATIRIRVAVMTLTIGGLAAPAQPCRVERIPPPLELAGRAEVIVYVRAQGEWMTLDRSSALPATHTRVRFLVLEVLKGSLPTGTLDVPLPAGTLDVDGSLIDADDRNDRPVPYDFVRPGGRHGNCFATTYRKGAEYLLLLAQAPGPAHGQAEQLTPYWAALAPTNEQVLGARDPWVVWIRQAVIGLRGKAGD